MLTLRNPSVVPLCVPPWEQREALEEGAKYSEALGFFAEDASFLDPFWKWLPRMYDPDAPRPILVPEMLPVTTWEQNIRHIMGTELWDRIRKHTYKAAGFRCEICGDRGRLEAHEKWTLENETTTQRLTKLMALCPLCHKVHHLGIARRLGMLPAVHAHLRRVNGWDEAQLTAAIVDAHEVWEQRCEWPWTVDMSWLHETGYLYV